MRIKQSTEKGSRRILASQPEAEEVMSHKAKHKTGGGKTDLLVDETVQGSYTKSRLLRGIHGVHTMKVVGKRQMKTLKNEH